MELFRYDWTRHHVCREFSNWPPRRTTPQNEPRWHWTVGSTRWRRRRGGARRLRPATAELHAGGSRTHIGGAGRALVELAPRLIGLPGRPRRVRAPGRSSGWMWMGGSIEQEIGPALHWRLEARHVDRGDPKPETVRAAPRMQSAPGTGTPRRQRNGQRRLSMMSSGAPPPLLCVCPM